MAELEEKLSVFTLDYSVDHQEYAIQYWTNDWEKLVELLENPYRFFKSREDRFVRDELPDGARDWTIRTPVTAVLRNGMREKNEAAKIYSLATHGQEPSFSELADLHDRLPEGGFVAEFAINTRTLLITYCPPDRRNIDRNRYSEGFSKLNLSLADALPIDSTNGTIHFDLGTKPTEWGDREWTMENSRARFSVAWLENHQDICEAIGEHARKDPGNIGWYAQRSLPLALGDGPPPRMPNPERNLVPSNLLGGLKFKPNIQVTTEFEGDLSRQFIRFPTLIVEGLSEGEPFSASNAALNPLDGDPPPPPPTTPPCLQGAMYYSDGEVLLDTTTIKVYA